MQGDRTIEDRAKTNPNEYPTTFLSYGESIFKQGGLKAVLVPVIRLIPFQRKKNAFFPHTFLPRDKKHGVTLIDFSHFILTNVLLVIQD